MSKICLLILSVVLVAGLVRAESEYQEAEAGKAYSYGYETGSHAAAEHRDPSGKVTGHYTLADADGRQRRVDYYADHTGFHSKVQTNEVGTKSANSADVEVQAAPPTQEQYAPNFVQNAPVVDHQQSRYVQATQSPAYFQQPISAQYGYYGQYQPASYGYIGGLGYTGANYGYSPVAAAPASFYSSYSNNNQMPSQYYKSEQSAQPGAYQVSSGYQGVVQHQHQHKNHQPAVGVSQYSPTALNSGVSSGVYKSAYQVPSSVEYPSSGNFQAAAVQQGSSNYIVLKKKRETDK